MDIAVVVQRQVASTRAGVMFTVNPATGERNEFVIEASFGLGEAVVSGSVSPDRYVIEKDPRASVAARREVHHKELVIEFDARRRHPHAAPLARGGSAADVWMSERSWLSPSSGCVSRSTTAPRRTPSGRLTPTGSCGCCRAVRSPHSTTSSIHTQRCHAVR